jgi:hypothetical protein
MCIPIVCLNERLSHYLGLFREVFSVPQYKYFVTILLGLMLCQSGNQTLSGLLEQTDSQVSLSGTSRFMGQAPWQMQDLANMWQEQFRQEMRNAVIAEHNRLQRRHKKKKKRGRPKKTVVTEPALSAAEGLLDRGRLDNDETTRQEDGRLGHALLRFREKDSNWT